MNSIEKVDNIIAAMRSVVVAFSGGVDSALLSHRCREVLGDSATAVLVDSPFIPRSELVEAGRTAEAIGIRLIVSPIDPLTPRVRRNTRHRCYYCKRNLLRAVRKAVPEAAFVVEGSNADDTADYRPGMRAVEELGVRSPFLEAGVTKERIRSCARDAGLGVWNKPAAACLASRIPYGRKIDARLLGMIEAGEDALAKAGFRQYRVRVHDDMARIEVAPDERSRFFHESIMDAVAEEFGSIGFSRVTVDLAGYSRGNLNTFIEGKLVHE